MKELLDQSHDKSSIYAVSKVELESPLTKRQRYSSCQRPAECPANAFYVVCENVDHVFENMLRI